MSGDKTLKLISVQDISCFGSCSQSVSHSILSAGGIETAMLPTAILSTHTGGFSGVTCLDLTDEMEKIAAHWKQEGLRFDAILSGYVSSARQIGVIRSLKELLTDGGIRIVDPAMADHGKMYHGLGEDVLRDMRKLVGEADIILPNMTEACLLLNREYRETPDQETIREMLCSLSELGPDIVVITGVAGEDGRIGAAAYSRKDKTYVYGFSRRMPRSYPGTGDIFAAVFTAAYLKGASLEESLQEACDFVQECIAVTLEDDSHGYGVKFERVLAGRRRK